MPLMTREEIETEILGFCRKEFEMESPEMDDDLREKHDFDSIDAIELLRKIQEMLHAELTQEEMKQAMDIRTLRQVCDYVEAMAAKRA
jgi:acyl carrier protein